MKLLRVLLLFVVGIAQAQDLFEVKTPFVAQKRWALVIGATKYTKFGPLSFSASDAKEFAKSLKEAFSFESKSVHLLVDDDPASTPPTAANILKELDSLLSNRSLEKGDLFVFYFSGHGVGLPSGDYLAPTDATPETVERVGVPVRDIISRFVKAGLKNVLVICDACRAGKQNPFGAELQALGKRSNIAVILGCAPGKRSYEYPQLGHGIFTYQLSKAMRSKDLRDPLTGALWASSIAKKTQKEVEAYTERDYGDDKQVPAIWGEGSTHDVMIGAFISPEQLTQVALSELQKQGKTMNRETFVLYLRAISATYLSFNMWKETIEAYKALDQLGEADANDLYGLAVALSAIGRDAESERILERILRDGGDKEAVDQAILALDNSKTTPDQRRRAARNMYDNSPEWINAYILWQIWSYHDPVPAPERKQILKLLVGKFGEETKIGMYFRASDYYLDNDVSKALDLLQKCFEVKGEEPAKNDLLMLFYLIADKLGNDELVDRIIKAGLADPQYKTGWERIEAMRLDKKKGAERLAAIKKLLAGHPGPDQLLDIVVSAGANASELLADVKKEVDRSPYSWKTHFSVWLCDLESKNFPLPPPGVDPNVGKYGPEPVELIRAIANNVVELMKNADASADKIEAYSREYFRFLLAQVPNFANNWQPWMELQSLSNQLGRQLQFGIVAKKYLAPAAADSKASVQVREILLDAYINAGLIPEAEALVKAGGWEGAEAKDGLLRWAIFLAANGHDEEAKLLYVKLKKPTHKSLLEMYTSLGLLIDARTKPSEELKKKIAEYQPDNLIAQQLTALAYGSFFKPKGAQPDANELVELLAVYDRLPNAVGNINDLYLDVHAACFKRMDEIDEYLTRSDPKASFAESLAMISTEHGGHPFYSKIPFSLSPSISEYVGKRVLLGKFYADDTRETPDGELEIDVKSDGRATLSVLKPTPIKIEGRVDKFGNLTGSVTSGGVTVTLSAKLLPTKFDYSKLDDVKPVIYLLSSVGRCVDFKYQKAK